MVRLNLQSGTFQHRIEWKQPTPAALGGVASILSVAPSGKKAKLPQRLATSPPSSQGQFVPTCDRVTEENVMSDVPWWTSAVSARWRSLRAKRI